MDTCMISSKGFLGRFFFVWGGGVGLGFVGCLLGGGFAKSIIQDA